MATGPITQISDIVVPSIFNPYVQQRTEEKSRLIASGAVVRSPLLDENLQGGGLTFNIPSFKDLDNDADNVSSDEGDAAATNSTPKKTGTATQIGVRLSRNQSWSTSDLATALSGDDPMASIIDRVSTYWARRLQAVFIATLNGVFADNAAAPSAASEHTINDLTNDIKGSSYSAGVTNFTSEAFIDAAVTMGDSMGNLSMVCVHSIVYSRMQKNDLIDFIKDSVNDVQIPTFLGRIVIVDDGLPVPSTGVYHTWLLGEGAVQLGMGTPKVPTETERKPSAGNGGGQDILFNRVEWCVHPVGHAYVGAATKGGPTNAATSNNLANAASWQRRYSERKQIKIARLITREA